MAIVTDVTRQIVDVLKSSLSVRGVITVLAAFSIIWLLAGVRLRGRLLAGWLVVPVLIGVACFCVAGQEHLFPDRSFEGPHLIRLGNADAITLTDLIGVTVAGIALVLALALVLRRMRAAEE